MGSDPRQVREPEVEAADFYGITAVAWFDLRDPAAWDPHVLADPITRPQIEQIRAALGYGSARSPSGRGPE